RTKSIRLRKPSTDSSEASSDALSITRISALDVVISNDSMQVRNQRPEFQLMIATALVMRFGRADEHDIHRISSERELRKSPKSVDAWQPRRIARQTVSDQVDARILADRNVAQRREPVRRQQPRYAFGIEEKVVLWNELTPPGFQQLE